MSKPTLKEKIKIMLHFERGGEVEETYWCGWKWWDKKDLDWDWKWFRYRIKK